MKKAISIALVLMMLIAFAAACGEKDTGSSVQSPAGTPSAQAPANSPDSQAPANSSAGQGSAPAQGGQEPAQPAPVGVPELNAEAAKRAEDAYAFIANLKQQASAYDKNAAKYRYTLNCQDPAESASGEFLYAWSDAVLVATEGAVYIDVGVSNAYCAGGTMEALNYMKDGLVDFCFTLPCYFKGYTPLALAIQNPALGIKNITVGAFSMWEMYKSMPAVQAEFAQHGEMMFVWANNPSPLSYKGTKTLDNISEIKGNIRGNNGPAQMFIDEVGASVYGCPIGDVYPNVSNGVIDYLITDWHAIASFKLADPGVLNYYLDTNVGCSAYVVMANSDVWKEIEKNGYADAIKSVSGDYCLNWVCIWEAYEAKGRSDAVNNGGTIYPPSGTFATDLQAAYDSVAQRWISENGANAKAVYDKAAELVSRYNAIYK